jgi:hypothetical protein
VLGSPANLALAVETLLFFALFARDFCIQCDTLTTSKKWVFLELLTLGFLERLDQLLGALICVCAIDD